MFGMNNIIQRPVRSLSLLILFACLPFPAVAQQMEEVRKVSGRVADSFSHEPIEGVSICLLAAADSSLLATYQPVGDDTLMYRHFGMFSFPVKDKGKYLIRTSCIGYKTVYTPFEVKYKREGDIWLKRIDMQRESRVLNEVTVTGTKIKMVLRGDTVVYNADAFNLAEGSMLDALIRQLPGAELSKDGEIKVNGKKIDNLLVDGRDFFEGDPKAALENLPAYTVNKIKVFDRKGKLTQMMGRDMDDKSYVMDVRLKKQYATSTFGNIEGGAGTDHRWGLKGMANRRSGKHQLSVAANVNNLNDQTNSYIMFGGGGISVMGYQPQSAQGVNTYRTADVGYSFGDWEDKLSGGLSINGSHNDSHTDTWTSSQTYLTGGDAYSRQANYARNRSRSLGGMARISLSPKGLVSYGSINFNYSDGKNHSNNRSAQFDADPAEYGDLLDDLFLHPDKYRTITMNRRAQQSQGDNRSFNLGGQFSADIKIMADVVSLSADANYGTSRRNTYQLSDVYYMKGGGFGSGGSLGTGGSMGSSSGELRDFRNQYTYAPNTHWNTAFTADYNYGMGQHNLRFRYRYSHNYNDGENSLYRLDRLDSTLTSLGTLPSTEEALLSVLDQMNSNTSTRHDIQNRLTAQLRLVPRFLGDGAINLELPVVYYHNTLDYFRQTSQHLTQGYWTFNPSLRIEYAPKRNDKQKTKVQGHDVMIISDTKSHPLIRASVRGSLDTSAPDIMSLVSYRDDSDPLLTTYSNPDLKKTRTLNVGADFSIYGGSRQKNIWSSLNYSRTFDAVATSMVYDKATGRTVTKPENVNGNWNLSGNIAWGQSLDEKRTLSFQNDLSGNYSHSVDLNSVAGAGGIAGVGDADFTLGSQRSTVNNTNLTERLSFTWRFASKKSENEFSAPQNSELSLNVGGSYNHVNGDRQDFQRINAGNFSYGGSLLLQLPWDFELNTTLTNYSRRGYSDPQMNTNELIWGARLTRRFLKGSLLLTLEGFDILGQLSNRNCTINEQGRTETYTNVISQYALIKLTYSFQRFPKGSKNPFLFF